MGNELDFNSVEKRFAGLEARLATTERMVTALAETVRAVAIERLLAGQERARLRRESEAEEAEDADDSEEDDAGLVGFKLAEDEDEETIGRSAAGRGGLRMEQNYRKPS